MNDAVVLVQQQVRVVDTVFHRDTPVGETDAVDAHRDGILVEQARYSRPVRMRITLTVLGEAHRQILRERRHVAQREIILAHEHEDQARDFLDRITGDAGSANELVFRVGDDGGEHAALQVEGEAVVPARNRFLVEAHRLLGETHAAVNTLILQRIYLAFYAAQHDRNAADLDALHLVFLKFIAEQGGIPMIDEAPGCILVGLKRAGSCSAGLGVDHAAAHDGLIRHFFLLLLEPAPIMVGRPCHLRTARCHEDRQRRPLLFA